MKKCVARGVCFRRPQGNPELSVLLIYENGGWRLPGGHLESGETYRDAVVREFREETGLDVAPKQKFHIVTCRNKSGVVCEEVFLFVSRQGGELRQNATNQGKSPDWFSVERLPRRTSRYIARCIAQAVDIMASRERRV